MSDKPNEDLDASEAKERVSQLDRHLMLLQFEQGMKTDPQFKESNMRTQQKIEQLQRERAELISLHAPAGSIEIP